MNQKIILCSIAIVAFLSACNKDTAKDFKAGSKTLTLEVGIPTAPEDSTKLAIDLEAKKQAEVLWTSGDAFRLYTCLPESEYSYDGKVLPDGKVTDCGDFTTNQNNVKKASFTGTIPAGAKSETDGIALFPANAFISGSQAVTYSSKKFMIRVRTTIPTVQDGTGVPYIRAVSRFKDGTLASFKYVTAMMKIRLAEGTGTTKITLTKADEASDKGMVGTVNAYYYFGSSTVTSSKQDCQNSLVVQRDNDNDGIYDELSGDIYFVTRPLSSGVQLTLKFENASGKSESHSLTTTVSFSAGRLIDYSTTPIKPSFDN